MDDERQKRHLAELASTAERLNSLADTAELMGDDDSATRWREMASSLRLRAMALLDGRRARSAIEVRRPQRDD